jgi:nucleotide-binding universal stress UspA family protein
VYRSILVPLDLSLDADRALPVGESLAQRIGVRLDVVCVTSPGIDSENDIEEIRAHARAMGVDLRGVHIRHDDDIVDGVLAEAASDDALLCCSSHARGRWVDLLLQSASADVVRRCPRPLVLVGPETEIIPRPRFTEVLACVDGSAATPRVASTAAMWGRLLEAKVHMVEVLDHDFPDDAFSVWPPAERVASTLDELGIDASWELVCSDDPAKAILAIAHQLGSPLLVMGTHSHPQTEHPALGRVSLAVVRDSPYPVLVVPFHPGPTA